MLYGLIFLILLVSILGYFRLADRFGIIDKPNERSSHKVVTIRGGGVIFPLAAIFWFLFFGFEYPWFILGLVLISIVSFLDDIYTLSTKPRLAMHLLSVVLLLFDLHVFDFPLYWLLIAFILIIGWINAFNFMDGINGITVFYTLSILVALSIANTALGFVNQSFINVLGISSIIFAFFNARKKARTFAGDVGSISLAFAISFLMVKLILSSGRWEYILFVGVYGVDSVLTIAHRLSKGENIFKPHRTHLYQYLANERSTPQVLVSALYAILQLAISCLVLMTITSSYGSMLAFSTLIVLGVIYILLKGYILHKLESNPIQ